MTLFQSHWPNWPSSHLEHRERQNLFQAACSLFSASIASGTNYFHLKLLVSLISQIVMYLNDSWLLLESHLQAGKPAYKGYGIAVGCGLTSPAPPGSYFFTSVSQCGNSIKCCGINHDLCQLKGENNQVLHPHLLSYGSCSDLAHTLKSIIPPRLLELLCAFKLWSFFAIIPCCGFWKGVFLPPLPTINEFVTWNILPMCYMSHSVCGYIRSVCL